MSDQLPRGWASVPLAQLCEPGAPIMYGILQPGPEVPCGVPYVRPTEIQGDEIKLDGIRRTSPEIAAQYKRASLRRGDILLSIVGTIGKVAVVPKELEGGNITQSSVRVRPGPVTEGSFVRWLLKSPQLVRQYDRLRLGTGVPRLNVGDVRELECPLPPLNEQRRIVAKLEALQARSRRAREALDAVPPLLEKLRQSILAAAFRGDLTKVWRAKHKDVEPASELLKRIRTKRRKKWEETELAKMRAKGKAPTDDKWKAKYTEPDPVDATGLPELPEEWCWASLAELAWDSGYGTSAKCDYDGEGVAVLRIPNIARGLVDLRDVKRALETQAEREVLVGPADLLIVRTNGSRDLIGRAAVIVDALPEPTSFASYLIRFRLVAERTMPTWVGRYWQSPFIRTRIEAHAASSAGQYNVSLGELASCPVPLAPLAEQTVILDSVEGSLASRGTTERGVKQLVQSLRTLERSILAKAFRGELAPQDPNDEPAHMMLSPLVGARDANEGVAQRAPRVPPNEKRARA